MGALAFLLVVFFKSCMNFNHFVFIFMRIRWKFTRQTSEQAAAIPLSLQQLQAVLRS